MNKKYKQKEANCPLCGNGMNKLMDDGTDYMGWYCEWKNVRLEYPLSGNLVKSLPHYKNDEANGITTVIIYPYRITMEKHRAKIAIHVKPDDPKATQAYIVGKLCFKTLITCPPLHMDTEEKLLNRIKTLVMIS